MLDIVGSYHCMQFQGKLMNQAWERKWQKKPSFGTNIDPFGTNLGPKNFFHTFYLYYIDIVASYHCMRFQGKLMNQTWENSKKPSFKTDFGLFGPNLGPKNFFHGFYPDYMLEILASYHCMQFQGKLITKLERMAKNLVLGLILAHLAHIWAPKSFFMGFTSTSC